jgi:hypothetical protein
MGALHEEHLSTQAGIVEVALVDDSVPALLDNNTNAVAVITAIDALTFVRLASITDLTVGVNTTEEKVEQRADDLGIIYSAYTPGVKVSMNWFESGNMEAIELLLGTAVIDVAVAGPNPAYKITGQNIKPHKLPQLIVRITGMDDADSHKEKVYLFDTGLNGEITRKFVDLTRTKEVPASTLEFKGNVGGFWLHTTERLPA